MHNLWLTFKLSWGEFENFQADCSLWPFCQVTVLVVLDSGQCGSLCCCTVIVLLLPAGEREGVGFETRSMKALILVDITFTGCIFVRSQSGRLLLGLKLTTVCTPVSIWCKKQFRHKDKILYNMNWSTETQVKEQTLLDEVWSLSWGSK